MFCKICSPQDSLRARKGLVRGINAIDQIENLSLYSATELNLPQRRRKHFSGTNHGNKIGDLHVPAVDTLWHEPKAVREKILGTALKRVGGPTPGVEVGRGNGAKDKAEVEAIWEQTMDSKFYKECTWSYCLKRAVNLSGSDGAFELAMRAAKVQTVTVCLNDHHKAALATRLEFHTLKAMCDSTNADHEPPLAALFSGEAPAKAKAPTQPKVATTKTAGVPPAGVPPKALPSLKGSNQLLAEMQARLAQIQQTAQSSGGEGGEGAPEETQE